MPDDLQKVHLDVVNEVLAEFSNELVDFLPELLYVECIVVFELLDAEFDVLLVLFDDVVLNVLLEPLDVVEAHLVQLLDGDVAVDLCAEFLDHIVGPELLMSSSLWFIYKDVVDVLLQVVFQCLMFRLCIR